MSGELFLHIGTTKTGSTAIQNTLSQRRRDLEQQGAYVQNRPAKASHSLLAASVLDDLGVAPGRGHPMWGGIAPVTRLERFRRDFALEMENLPRWAERCIISSEHLSHWLQREGEVHRLAALLRPYFDRITVIVYLRRQDQHASSGYNEILKSGVIPSAELPASPDSLKALDYQIMLERYAGAFGQEAVKPRIFARENLLNSNVVDDFLHAVGIELTATDAVTSNQSINATGQALLARAIGRLGRAGGTAQLNTRPEWRALTQAVESQCRGAGWKPSAAAAQAFMALFSASNEAVRATYFPHRPELFSSSYAEGAGDLPPPTADTLVEACIDVAFRVAQMHCEREAHLAMAQYKLFARLDDQAGMRDMLRLAVRQAPNNVAARLRTAELMMADGRTAEALDHLDAVLRLDPQNKEAQRKRANWIGTRRDGTQPARMTASRPARQPIPRP